VKSSEVAALRPLVSIVLLALLTACGVARVEKTIRPGQSISLDPCGLADLKIAEQILGAPVKTGLGFAIGDKQGSCILEKSAGPDAGPTIWIFLGSETRESISNPEEGSQESKVDAARLARIKESSNEVQIWALSQNGVEIDVRLADARPDMKSRIAALKDFVSSAVKKTDTDFPGDFTLPSPSQPPIPPCEAVPIQEVEKYLGHPGPEGWQEVKNRFFFEQAGGKFGGGWHCHYFGPNPGEDFKQNTLSFEISRDPITVDQMKEARGVGEEVPKLGAYAYWMPKEVGSPWLMNAPAWLAVITPSGRRLTIWVDLSDLAQTRGTDPSKAVAVELARKILPRLD
jgi:hypothetical protein